MAKNEAGERSGIGAFWKSMIAFVAAVLTLWAAYKVWWIEVRPRVSPSASLGPSSDPFKAAFSFKNESVLLTLKEAKADYSFSARYRDNIQIKNQRVEGMPGMKLGDIPPGETRGGTLELDRLMGFRWGPGIDPAEALRGTLICLEVSYTCFVGCDGRKIQLFAYEYDSSVKQLVQKSCPADEANP